MKRTHASASKARLALALLLVAVLALGASGCQLIEGVTGKGSNAGSDAVSGSAHPDLFIGAIPTEPPVSAKPVSSLEDLLAINDNPGGSYYLTCDIDLSAASALGIGGSTGAGALLPLIRDDKPFAGILDGQGYVLKGLYRQAGDASLAGLFGLVGNSGIVKNIGLERTVVKLDGPSQEKAAVGGIAAVNYGFIENCFVTGIVSAVAGGLSDPGSLNASTKAAGICAENFGTIRNCYYAGQVGLTAALGRSAAGGIVAVNTGSVEHCAAFGGVVNSGAGTSWRLAGGIVGLLTKGSVSDCFTAADVSSAGSNSDVSPEAGGIVGRLEGPETRPGPSIARCLVTGNISAETEFGAMAGGLAGFAGNWGEIRDCVVLANAIEAIAHKYSASSGFVRGDGFLEEGMPQVEFSGNYALKGIKGINMGFGVEELSLDECGRADFYLNLGWDASLWEFYAADEIAGMCGAGVSGAAASDSSASAGAGIGIGADTDVRFNVTWLPSGIFGLPVVCTAGKVLPQAPRPDELMSEMEAALAQAGVEAKNGDSSKSSTYADASGRKQERVSVADVEAEVSRIRAIWTAVREAQAAGAYATTPLDGGAATAYSEGGQLLLAELARGTYGLDYLRIYEYENGQLIFAYFEGADQNRMYYKDGWLFRWRHTDAAGNVENHDNAPSEPDFLNWESRAWEEGNKLKDMFVK
jgi:hypothetical protein